MVNKNKDWLKISEKSKNVTKFKSKTPAQDRLQKFQKVIASNIDECKKLVIENTLVKKPKNITKPNPVNIAPKEPARSVANIATISREIDYIYPYKEKASVDHKKGDDRNKMTKKNPFKRDGNKDRFSLQSHLKISEKSKNVKKNKSKTSVQNRLLKYPKLISSNLNVLSSLADDEANTKHNANETDSEKILRIADNANNNCIDSAQEQNEPKDNVPADGRLKKAQGFSSLFILKRKSDVRKKVQDPYVDSSHSLKELESMTEDVLSNVMSYIVPDTNVFIHSLASIKTILEEGSNSSKPNIFIPNVVLAELDRLKHREKKASLKLNAIRAIDYIYDQMKSKNPRLQGQKATKDGDHIIEINSPDDRILNCCLQLKNQSKNVTLITNDKNLSIKAIFNGVHTITAKKCLDIY